MSDGLQLDLRLDIVEAALNRMRRFGYNLRPLFRDVRKDLRADQIEHRKQQEGPDGGWPQLAASTIAKRRQRPGKQGRKRRRSRYQAKKSPRMLGRLPSAMDVKYDDRHVEGRSRVKWSGVHNAGGVAGRGSIIPKREYLWTSGKLLGTVAKKAAGMLVDSFLGKLFG